MKICNADGCYSPVFGGGFCRRHQYHRTDKKRKEHALKIKVTTVRNFEPFGFADQTSMFLALWEQAKDKNGDVFCQFTGKRLTGFFGQDVWYSCFMHVLPKGRYSYFKLNPANIRIGHPLFHTLVDQGTAEQRAQHPDWRFDLWYDTVETMKEEYKKYKQKNHLP